MIHDLRTILDGWEYETGKISVRKIIGQDGREKVQTRVDLGVIQFEVDSRPDGARPFGYESLLEYHEARLRKHIRKHRTCDHFTLSPEECLELRQEAHLYYQRYLSMFVLEEYDAVERDTARNLRVLDFCRRYAAEPDDRNALETQRAYVTMMNLRARAYRAMSENHFEAALALIDNGIEHILALCEQYESEEPAAQRQEVRVLRALRDEILDTMPDNAPSKLRWELEMALAIEDYERAAQLRNRLATILPSQFGPSSARSADAD